LAIDHGAAHVCTASPFLRQVEPEVALDVIERDGDQQVVDVVAAEVRVAVGGDDLEDAVVQLEDRDVERAAAEIVNRDGAVSSCRDRRRAQRLSAR
jgi:hypothetical protein